MPNVVDLIEQDHREVEDLFSKFESSGDRSVAAVLLDAGAGSSSSSTLITSSSSSPPLSGLAGLRARTGSGSGFSTLADLAALAPLPRLTGH